MKKVLKVLGLVVLGLGALLLLAGIAAAIYAQRSFKPVLTDRPLYAISADTSPQGLARGQYLVEQAMNCTEACHTADGGQPLAGRIEPISDGPVQALFAVPNLTPHETGLAGWSDAEIARAIREGVDKDGRALLIMPSYNYFALSDADVAAIVGYLRSMPPVEQVVPPFEANLMTKLLLATGAFGPNPVQAPIVAPQETPARGTLENGAYMVKLGACSDCHQANYAGGQVPLAMPGTPPAANLTPAGELAGWTPADFVRAVKEGFKPNGQPLHSEMPRYPSDEQDLIDIFTYLQTLPAAQPET